MQASLNVQPENQSKLIENERTRRNELFSNWSDNVGPSIVAQMTKDEKAGRYIHDPLAFFNGKNLVHFTTRAELTHPTQVRKKFQVNIPAGINHGGELFERVRRQDLAVTFYESLLTLHLTRRADLAFIQLAMADRTNLRFVAVDKPDQVKGVGNVNLTYGRNRERIQYQMAHSATFPRLVFSLPGAIRGSKCDKEGSAIHHALNAAIDFPEEVNHVDSNIDDRGAKRLRPIAIAQINQVALGKCSPQVAHRRFLESLRTCLQTETQRRSSQPQGSVAAHHLNTLECYSKELTDIRYDWLLGLSLPAVENVAALRKKIWPIRIVILRRRNERQSFFHQALLSCERIMLKSKSRPCCFHHALLAAVLGKLASAGHSRSRGRLEEMYGQSKEHYEARCKRYHDTKELVQVNDEMVEGLSRKAKQHCLDYDAEDYTYRRLALNRMRTWAGQDEAEIGRVLNIESSEVLKIEKGEKGHVVTDQMVNQLAEHFNTLAVNLAIDVRGCSLNREARPGSSSRGARS